MTHPAPRRLHGVVYPDPTPPPDGPAYTPQPDPHDELAMARHHVRTAFDPPLPDAFAHWLIQLHALVRDGAPGDYLAAVPADVRELGYTFVHAFQQGDLLRIRLDDALRAFNRHDLLTTTSQDDDGFPALAAALVAHGIRTTTTIHHSEHAATVRLTGAQAKQLADTLIPAEGSVEDDLALALELLDHFVHGPRPTPCWFDHHGHCQEHHDDLGHGRFAQHEGYALLVRRGVRTEQP